jgi:hypothetical protein
VPPVVGGHGILMETMAILLHPRGFRWRIAEIGRSQFRVREVGNNGGPDVRRFQSATWLAPGPWPWCAAFVCWCYRQAASQLAPGLLPTRPQTPRAFGFESWGKLHGGFSTDPRKIILGDIVIFRFSHVGIALQNYEPGPLGIVTVEGNTDAQASREGDGVWQRNRPLSSVRSFIRFYESATPQTPG